MDPARRHVAVGLAVAALVAIGLVLSPGDVVDQLRAWLTSPWFPAILVGLYLVRPLLAWPITALSVLVGYRYGVAVGVPLALLGAVATSLLPYALARHYRDRAGPFAGLVAGSERFFAATGGLRGVIAVRLAPTPAEPVSIAAGAGRVGVGTFVAGTAIGELPWTVAAVVAGHSLSRLSLAGALAVDPWVVLLGLAGAAVLLARPAYRWLRRRRVGEAAG
ncbi:MAG: TVP38/TMEM64 family protein [Halobacteriales archaeon]